MPVLGAGGLLADSLAIAKVGAIGRHLDEVDPRLSVCVSVLRSPASR